MASRKLTDRSPDCRNQLREVVAAVKAFHAADRSGDSSPTLPFHMFSSDATHTHFTADTIAIQRIAGHAAIQLIALIVICADV